MNRNTDNCVFVCAVCVFMSKYEVLRIHQLCCGTIARLAGAGWKKPVGRRKGGGGLEGSILTLRLVNPFAPIWLELDAVAGS
jgi:hypothetical protein